MLSTIIETIASALAEHFAGKAAEKGLQRTGKARGWIALGILVALFAFLVGLGVYLIALGMWPIGVLMLAIAGLVAYVTAASAVRGRRGRG